MLSFRNVLVAGATLLFATPAMAQMARQEGLVRIQITINFFAAGPTGDGEEAQKLRDKASRIVYQMAAHECDLLRETLAKDCRMEAVNTNIGRQFGQQQQQDGYTVNGSMSFQISPK